MGEIEVIHGVVSPRALLGQVMGREGVDGVVIVVRIDDKWQSCWSSGVNMGGLSMAALALQHDVIATIYSEDSSDG